jgi:hypothetical protein
MHKGGIADKVGNRYEARWLTYQLLGLLDGNVQSIKVEALGDEEEGFEFSLVRAGSVEWHQCKRQTATGNWTIPALAAAGVLTAFCAKIASDGAQCLFISSDPARELKLLQEKHPATHSREAFVASLSKEETKHWGVLQWRLGGDADAFRFLGHTKFRTLSESDLIDVLRARIACWFKGDPDMVAARFRAWLEEDWNFNRPIGYDDVIQFVHNAGIEAKQYEIDRALPGRIREATSSYVDSYPPIGEGLYRIKRAAVGQVLTALQDGARVVLVTGAAGMGKSAVIAELIERLRDNGTLHLALRVDQLGAIATLDQLGERTVGTADNPVLILEQLAVDKRAVLIVDQADAISEVSGRIAELRRVVLDLARKTAHYPRVQLVFACRSFDLENDSGYRQIAEAKGNVRIEVEPFSRIEIDPVLTRLGILYDSENSRLMALLALPIGLTLAATLAQRGTSDLRCVEHLSQLYEELLRIRDHEIRRDFRPSWSIYSPLTALAKVMSERQALVASVAALDPFAGASDFLQRAGLILVRGQRVSFIHESLFDYLHARAFVNDGTNLIDFLLASEQTLFRRTQTRQILTFERETERARYMADLKAILSDTRVRPHIRETIVRWLATVPDPTFGEWELVARYAERSGLPRKAGSVIFNRRPWFDLLLAQGVIDNWLASDGDDLRWTFSFLHSLAPLTPTEVSALVDRFLNRRADHAREALGALRFVDLKVAKVNVQPLADSLIAAINQTTPEDWGHGDDDWSDCFSSWIATAPEEAARIFGAQLARWFDLNPEGHLFEHHFDNGRLSFYWLNELAKATPLAFLEQFLPFMRLAMERTRKNEDLPARDDIWYLRLWNRTEVPDVDLLRVVRAAFAQVARSDPQACMRLLRSLQPEANITSLHLLLETVPANPRELCDLLIEQLDNPGLFKAGWYNADGHSAGLAIASVMPWLTEAERARAESMVLALQPEIASASRALARESDAHETQSPCRTQSYATYCLNDSGKREWSVLRQIGVHQLSPRAAKRLAELDRKFIGQTPEQPDGIRGGFVRSPIAGDCTKHMNDHAWLTAIRKFSGPRQSRRSRDDGLRDLKGGATELSVELMNRSKEEPERFLALLERFPVGAHQDFACGVTDGIAEAKPNSDTIERVLAIVDANPAARPDDRSLIRLIRACAEPLGTRAEAFLLKIATDDDDSTGIGDIENEELSTEPNWKFAFKIGSNLAGKSINSARGSALEILGHICWLSKQAFDKYRPAIDPIIGTPVAAHIHFSLDNLLMSALKHEGKQGVEWVLRTARSCPESFYSNNGAQIFGWVAELDEAGFRQLTNLYLESQDSCARSFAGLVVFQRCLDDPEWMQIAESLIGSDVEYRSAAAAVAAANFESARFGTICTDWLLRFFNDEDAMVRREASDCFRRMKHSDITAHAGLFEAYVASPYFEANQSYFIHRLKSAPPGLDDLLLNLLENALKARVKDDINFRAFELRDIGDIVLKIYASNVDHPERRTRALDLIDGLVEHGLMELQKLETA